MLFANRESRIANPESCKQMKRLAFVRHSPRANPQCVSAATEGGQKSVTSVGTFAEATHAPPVERTRLTAPIPAERPRATTGITGHAVAAAVGCASFTSKHAHYLATGAAEAARTERVAQARPPVVTSQARAVTTAQDPAIEAA